MPYGKGERALTDLDKSIRGAYGIGLALAGFGLVAFIAALITGLVLAASIGYGFLGMASAPVIGFAWTLIYGIAVLAIIAVGMLVAVFTHDRYGGFVGGLLITIGGIIGIFGVFFAGFVIGAVLVIVGGLAVMIKPWLR